MDILIKNKKENFPQFRVPSGCAIFGVINESGERFNGEMIMDGISVMHERSNGLGGGFAVYGIYPDFASDRVFHIFYDDTEAKKQTEGEIRLNFKVLLSEEIPTRKISKIMNPPLMYRYFLQPKENFIIQKTGRAGSLSWTAVGQSDCGATGEDEDNIVKFVMHINKDIRGAYIISSGKNMGIFKGVGYPEDIGWFFKLDEYKGYIWTSHGRFPTNSVGWWGGAHPFGLLNWSVVHNGEISSYGTNKRFVSSYGYDCTLSTDTEVITYLFDLILRKQKISPEIIHLILASPLWEEIEKMKGDNKEALRALRIIYGNALLNGPFSIIVGNSNYIYALNDRIKLRPLVAARKDDYLFISSEEASIRKVCPYPDCVWQPAGGEPIIGKISEKAKEKNAGNKVSKKAGKKSRLIKSGNNYGNSERKNGRQKCRLG
jgi:glutamate synthase domain-containing protein 1